MAAVRGFCIDRWEASLIDRKSRRPLSPYYPPQPKALGRVREIDGRTDIYGLGATLHHALSGQPLHQGLSDASLLIAAATREVPSLATVAPGLPTLLGWAGHEYQWRGYSTPEPAERDPVVRDVYTVPGWDNGNIVDRLNAYGVAYIYVGNLERNTYGIDGRLTGQNKFSENLEVAYQNGSVTIYRWQASER